MKAYLTVGIAMVDALEVAGCACYSDRDYRRLLVDVDVDGVTRQECGVSHQVIDSQVDVWRRRRAAQQVRRQRLRRQAEADAHGIAHVLREQYGAGRIILFGSVVGTGFHGESDIDLAVSGLAKDRFFAALAHVSQLSELPVDLKPLEDLEPDFKARVIATGRDI